MDEQTIVVFECDGKQCRECMGECRHTTDVRHAKNFKRVEPGYYEEIVHEASARDESAAERVECWEGGGVVIHTDQAHITNWGDYIIVRRK